MTYSLWPASQSQVPSISPSPFHLEWLGVIVFFFFCGGFSTAYSAPGFVTSLAPAKHLVCKRVMFRFLLLQNTPAASEQNASNFSSPSTFTSRVCHYPAGEFSGLGTEASPFLPLDVLCTERHFSIGSCGHSLNMALALEGLPVLWVLLF